MNKISTLITISCALTVSMLAQTNIFPANGNVGIGVTSPAVPLHVKKVSGPDVALFEADYAHTYIRLRNKTGESSLSTSGNILYVGDNAGAICFRNGPEWTTRLVVQPSGNIAIGTSQATHLLTVNGPIRAKEVIVDTGWADDVFEHDYNLMPLTEVKRHVEANKRLPGVPSAGEVASEGVSVGEMQSLLLRKVEELTLHVIRQQEEIDGLRRKLETRTVSGQAGTGRSEPSAGNADAAPVTDHF